MDFRNHSRLPAAPEYWEQLANRIDTSREVGNGRSWLRAASLVAFVSAAAAAAAFLLTPAPRTVSLADALAPRDPVAALFTSYDEVRP
jgi:hypothetical protein